MVPGLRIGRLRWFKHPLISSTRPLAPQVAGLARRNATATPPYRIRYYRGRPRVGPGIPSSERLRACLLLLAASTARKKTRHWALDA